MLLGQVVKLDPLAMFLNCLGESSLSYKQSVTEVQHAASHLAGAHARPLPCPGVVATLCAVRLVHRHASGARLANFLRERRSPPV